MRETIRLARFQCRNSCDSSSSITNQGSLDQYRERWQAAVVDSAAHYRLVVTN
jgi:hypothetical protein